MNAKKIISCIPALMLLVFAACPALADETAFSIKPENVSVGMLYGGTRLAVSGVLPAGDRVAVVCQGKEEPLTLKKIGKVWGVLWMTVGKVKFDSVMDFYRLVTSTAVKDLAGPGALQNLGVGYESLAAVTLKGKDDPENRRLFGEMVKLKEKEGLYKTTESGITIAPKGEIEEISASLWIPPNTPMGEYNVRVYAFRNGEGRLVHSQAVKVRPVGTVAMVRSMALKHGLVYGIVSVIIALLAGLLTGFLFGLGGKGGH